jgi:hypothetical protein
LEDARELALELMYGLPSKRMVDVCSMAIFANDTHKFAVKSRYDDIESFEIMKDENNLTYYNEHQPMGHHYNEIYGKNVVFHKSLLNQRGLEAFEKVFKNVVEVTE